MKKTLRLRMRSGKLLGCTVVELPEAARQRVRRLVRRPGA